MILHFEGVHLVHFLVHIKGFYFSYDVSGDVASIDDIYQKKIQVDLRPNLEVCKSRKKFSDKKRRYNKKQFKSDNNSKLKSQNKSLYKRP